MWRVVYQAPGHRVLTQSGPWHPTKEKAQHWADFLRPWYPEVRVESIKDASPNSGVASTRLG